MSTVGNRQEMIACQILPQTVHRVIQRCCTVADCDNTSNPEFHSEPPRSHQGGGEGDFHLCVGNVGCQAIGQLTQCTHTQTHTVTHRKSSHLNVTMSH